MNVLLALANVVVKEIFRRKDFYVLFVLTAVITLVMGSVTFFDDPKITLYVKELSLALIWLSALVVAVGMTARQLPAERESRTIFPLLAKPVTRGQVIVGKFLGCWFATGLALLVFYVFFAVVSGSREHHWPVVELAQAVWLHWMMLGVVIALVLCGSLVFSAPSANATICVVAVLGILLLGRYLNLLALKQPEPLQTILQASYFIIPHLEWYDVRDFLVFRHAPIGWGNMTLVTLYGAAYIALFLVAGWWRFRRLRLNV